jgi:hypothetical protein
VLGLHQALQMPPGSSKTTARPPPAMQQALQTPPRSSRTTARPPPAMQPARLSCPMPPTRTTWGWAWVCGRCADERYQVGSTATVQPLQSRATSSALAAS